jgi:hypothetical protein
MVGVGIGTVSQLLRIRTGDRHKTVSIGHLNIGQGFGIDHLVRRNDLIPEQQPGGHRIDLTFPCLTLPSILLLPELPGSGCP